MYRHFAPLLLLAALALAPIAALAYTAIGENETVGEEVHRGD